jgi:hypothetical protein
MEGIFRRTRVQGSRKRSPQGNSLHQNEADPEVGISGFIIYNVSSSDLGPDNGYTNRYELGLFDAEDPDNHEDLDRLENLYLRYFFNSHRESSVQLGKFHLSTPLINLQDTRIRPNIQEGLWAEFKDWEKLKFRGGWLWSITPRSTVEWYGIGESESRLSTAFLHLYKHKLTSLPDYKSITL